MKSLLKKAEEAMNNSYSPYSSYKVGAALLCSNGKIYTGTNIENVAFSPTLCAERVAFAKAISEGEREFSAIAVVNNKNTPCTPCGVCRQFMQEFCDSEFKIITRDKTFTLSELLPHAFKDLY